MTWAIDQGFLGLNSPQSWFREFYQENINSVNFRYHEDSQIPDQAKYCPVMGVLNSRHPQEIARRFADLFEIAIYKLANCWHYNSCDHKYNEQDLVWQEIEKIKKQAIAVSGLSEDTISESEEYDVAPWCYSDNDWKKYITWVRERKNQKSLSFSKL